MRTYLYILILLAGAPAMLLAQPALQRELNLPRLGDKLVKQQVEYEDPGRSGANVVWDFGHLQAVNQEYKLTWSVPRMRRDSSYILGKDTFQRAEGLFVGREHNTNYFYRLQDSILFLLGYENRMDLMHYVTPLTVMKYPMFYEQKFEQEVNSENLFSSLVPMKTHGKIVVEADAWGLMILPFGDTLEHVLRIHSVQNQLADTVKAMDSIRVNTTIESYRWYASGYRYPVFETVKTIHKHGLDEDVFKTAFFFPPQEQHTLPDDLKNLAALDSIHYAKKVNEQSQDPWEGLSYKILPNPFKVLMVFELNLPRPVNNLRIQISNPMGVVFIDAQKGAYPAGINRFTFNVSTLPLGNYTLNFWLDEYLIHGSIVMKR